MIRLVTVASILLTLLILLPGCSSLSGKEFQYQMDLQMGGKENSKIKVEKEWVGRGDKITEDFSVDTYPDTWEVWSSNNPDTDDWQDGSGVLQIILHNRTTGQSTEVLNSFRTGRSNWNTYEAGTFYLEIKSVNTRWIVRILVPQDPDIFIGMTAGAYDEAGKDPQIEGLPLGCKWGITGLLYAQRSNRAEPLPDKVVGVEEIVNGQWKRLGETHTKSGEEGPPVRTVARYNFEMKPILIPGEYQFRVVFDGQDKYSQANEFVRVRTVHRAFVELDCPDKGSYGGHFKCQIVLKDYLEKKPLAGAPVDFEFASESEPKWIVWNDARCVTDASGEAEIDLGEKGKYFPQPGSWKVRAKFPGGKYNDYDYRPAESRDSLVEYKKGTPKIELQLASSPSVSFTTFKIGCTLQNEVGESISSSEPVILWATHGGIKIPLPLGQTTPQGPDSPLIFPVSLESGDYTFWADFYGDGDYESVTSRKLDVHIGD